MKTATYPLLMLIGLFWLGAAGASDNTADGSYRGLDQEVQSLQQDLLALSRDLFLLEEELLFPATTQVTVFLSLDVGQYFELDAVQLKIGGRDVASHLYTERESDALRRGGVQRLYTGNLNLGEHEIVAFFTGKAARTRLPPRRARWSPRKSDPNTSTADRGSRTAAAVLGRGMGLKAPSTRSAARRRGQAPRACFRFALATVLDASVRRKAGERAGSR